MKTNFLFLFIYLLSGSGLIAQQTSTQQPNGMDTIMLKNWKPRSSVVTQETFVPKAAYPAIEIHAHPYASTPEEVATWVNTMDEVGIGMVIVLTGATGKDFDKLVDLYLKKYPKRFQLWCGLDTTNINKPEFSLLAAAELERCYSMGARGIGEIMEKGGGFTMGTRDKMHPDDPRMDAFWEKAAELKLPVNIHIADHPSCWTPLDNSQERTRDYQHYNQVGKDVLSYEDCLIMMGHMLTRHPKTTFILAHLANQGNDLGKLSKDLDKYPNMYLDISGRNYEIGRTPRASAKFITKYQNRILFGTDAGNAKTMYQSYWRLLESADEYIPGPVWWRLYGLELPKSVLEPLYRGNALKLLNVTIPVKK